MSDALIIKRTLTISNQRGLHARAAAKFVQCAETFKAHIKVMREGTDVEGTSIMGLLMLAASLGTQIEVHASGTEAQDAVDAIAALVNAKFYEDQE